MKRNFLYALLSLIVVLASCDEGRIYEQETVIPKEGLTLKMTASSITGVSSWPSMYQLVVATLKDESISQYKLIESSSEGNVTVYVSGITDEITELQFCIINRTSRKSIFAYKTIEKSEFNAVNDTIYMQVGDVDANMFSTIQSQIFDAKCISCHGSTGSAPRNLFLTEEKSYASIVNQPSLSNPEYKLVDPENASGSLLPMVLDSNGLLAHDHADILDARDKSELVSAIRAWINNGAKE